MIVININKAKAIGHEIRRIKREEEFTPLDAVIMKQIPGVSATEAETARQTIRNKYKEIQVNIDVATTLDEIKFALSL